MATLSASADSTRSSILVIDDDAPLARSMQILLEDEGRHHVAIAPSADHALVALRTTSKVDLLIIDLAILDEIGAKLAQAIQNRPGGVAVIAMTAHEAALDAARSRRINANGFLAKPIDPSALLAMVGAALSHLRPRTGDHPPSATERNLWSCRGTSVRKDNHLSRRKP